MSDKGRRFTRQAIQTAASNLVWSYWPIWGAPIVTAAFAWLSDRPADLIALGTFFAFATMTWGLNNLSQWTGNRSPSDKVSISVPIIGIHNNNAQKTTGIKLGIAAKNGAPFPVEIRIDALDTQIANRVPRDPFFSRSITVAPSDAAHITNALIDLDQVVPDSGSLLGRINAKISYGRPGNLRFRDERQFYVALMFSNGEFQNAEVSQTEIAII